MDASTWALIYQQQDISDDAVFDPVCVRGSIDGMRKSGRLTPGYPGHPKDLNGFSIICGLDPAMIGDTAGNIKTFLTVNGYQMRVEPVEKRIQQEDGKWIVYNEEGTRSFGSYDSKEEAEERLRQIHAFSKADDTYTPPKAVRAAAQRAIEWIDNGLAGDGFTSVGRTRAGQLARGENISIETLKRMKSFFSRHAVDDKAVGFNRGEKGFPSAGRVAWDAWGGDAGFAWAESMVERYENRVEKHGDHDQSSHGAWAGGNAGGEDGGASRPRMADDVKPSSERSADAVKQAERLRRDAEAVEPAVTSLMEGIAKTIGADFAVLDGKSSLVPLVFCFYYFKE